MLTPEQEAVLATFADGLIAEQQAITNRTEKDAARAKALGALAEKRAEMLTVAAGIVAEALAPFEAAVLAVDAP